LERRLDVRQDQEKIAAVVVTYNRKDLLGQCLDSLLRQTCPFEALYIIDNHSTDGTGASLLAQELIAPAVWRDDVPVETTRQVPVPAWSGRALEVRYVRMPDNTGGAGGFHEGMKRAVAGGFDWLWLMDDDLLTAPDALDVLVRQRDALRNSHAEPFILNSLVLRRDGSDGDTLAFPLRELSPRRDPKSGVHRLNRKVCLWRLSEVRWQAQDGLYRWICPFNGTFVPARAATEIGLPNKEFFLWGDELDFLWRADKRYTLYTVLDSRVFHPAPRAAEFGWRQYYRIRNLMIVNRHFNFATLRNVRVTIVSLGRGLRHGPRGLRLVLRAVADGWTGRLGRREDLGP
jgi:rhamnopyranosyl-N-acetylglucosaminyl-diphospho-decaprenol beta-1,3/1,4-galactofuranosyltransferase